MTAPRHILLGGMAFRLDESQAEVTMRRISDSLMAPRQDISGIPGALNLQRDMWLWTMSDWSGGEGRKYFDSADPLGPPTFWKSEGGIDVRKRGEFSLHPDESLITNKTGGGSVPIVSSWANTALSTESGSPTYNYGPSGDAILLGKNDEVQTPGRTPGAAAVRVYCRFTNARPKRGNKVSVRFRVRNVTDGNDTITKSVTNVRDGEGVTLTCSFTAVAGKTYRYLAANIDDDSDAEIRVKKITEEVFGTGPASSINMYDLRLGIGENVYGLAWDGTSTDVLVWNFSSNSWDQAVANMVASEARAMSGSDQYMYSLHANGEVWRWDSSSAVKYAANPNDSNTGFETQNFGAPLGIMVSNNKVYTLFQQGLFQLTADLSTSTLLASGDYSLVGYPGDFYKELNPNTTYRQRMAAISNGVRFFINVTGEQSVIYEFITDEALQPIHSVPSGYTITAIKHYANITFIGATFTNRAATPAEKRAGVFYISADNLLYFLGYLRFDDSNSQPIQYISSYGHDVYFLQGRRIWRYHTGTGGITVENETTVEDQSKPRAMARMDKKFWVAVEDEGTFVSDDEYPRIPMFVYSPLWDNDVPDIDKVLLSVDLQMEPLPANTIVYVEYAVDESDLFTLAGTISTPGTTEERITISDASTTVKFRSMQWRVGLASTDGSATPRIRAVTTRTYVLEYEDSFELTVLLDDDDAMNRLQGQQLSARAKANRLWSLKQSKELTTFVDHYSSRLPGDADTYTVIIEDPFQEMVREGQSSLRMRLKVVT